MTDIPEHDPAEAQLSSDLATIIDILPEVMDEERPMSEVEAFASQAVYDAIQNASNGTARSQQAQDFRIGVSTLGHCLAAETEIPTKQGIVKIGTLAGKTAELLVPIRNGNTVGGNATWREVEVREFGTQPLMRITLTQLGGSMKVIHATAEHEWFVTSDPRNRNYRTEMTSNLKAGDRMKGAKATGALVSEPIPAAIVMGFIHGDGNFDHSGSEVKISSHGNKVESLMPDLLRRFSRTETITDEGARYRGFPYGWKGVPDFSVESAAFALSWLAGYFAADGSVSSTGSCTVQSSSKESIDALRHAASIGGITCNPPVARSISGGYGLGENERRDVYTITIQPRTVPGWFFMNDHHRARAKSATSNSARDRSWVVKSVELTDRIEPVYCAIVPDVDAFLLTEDLVTHNCKQFAKLMMTETPFSDERDKTPAFFGTVSGDAIEKQLRIDHPDWLIQESTVFHIPSGGEVGGHYDVVVPSWAATEEHPQGVRDLKSKSELETIKKMGQSRQQIYQLHAYAKGCIDEGLFDLSKPIYVMNVFYDRSGNTREPYTIATLYRDDVVGFIDEWINDVKYAVLNGEDAEREMPRSWCASWCEYATVCRGADTDVEGLIEDPELVVAITSYAEAAKTVTAAEKVKKALKPILTGHSGSTGKHNMRWIEIGESEVAFTRKAYMKLDIRPVSVPKPPKAKKKEEGES